MDDIKIELGHKIRDCRKKNKITQVMLAELIGTNQDYISKLETGKINPTLDTLKDIAEVLKGDIRKILNVFS